MLCILEKAHPNARKWHKKPFPLYDDMLELIDGIVATGESAFCLGQAAHSQDLDLAIDPVLLEESERQHSMSASSLPPGTGYSSEGGSDKVWD
jgi:hypothetical protein